MNAFRVFLFLAALGLAAPLFGQNVLLNPSFSEPTFAGYDSCPRVTNYAGVTGWTGLALRNASFYIPPCPIPAPADPGDATCASMSSNRTNNPLSFYQTVAVSPGTTYTLKGWWLIGRQSTTGTFTARAEVHAGTDPGGTMVGYAENLVSASGQSAWLQFSANVTPTTAQVTVVIKGTNTGEDWTGWALHADQVSLAPATCLNPPTISSINPTYGVRGSTLTGVGIIGTNLTPDQTSIKLAREGQPDIVADNVNASGTSATCDLNLTGAQPGTWDVVVSVGNTAPTQLNCDPATLVSGFLVILPSFQNGSFEDPTAAGGCPAVPLTGRPTDWSFLEINSYGYDNALIRDSDVFPPTCPPPDGLHYGSSTSNHASGADASIYQTIAVTPDTGYSFSGFFAGGGNNTVKLQLRDGDLSATTVGEVTIHNPSDGVYDWTFASVFGRPSSNMMTVVWYIHTDGAGPHAAHADALAVESCDSTIALASITPDVGTNNGTVNVSISGIGFDTQVPAVVQLSKGSSAATADPVSVASETEITCTFDLTGLASGKYNLLVKQGGCASVLPADDPNAFQVVAAEFINGSFEEPTAPVNHGTCTQGSPPSPVGGIPTGWNTDGNMLRDGNAPLPPNTGTTCVASTDGGHYGTLSSGEAGMQRAWQTISVIPGQHYKFTGQFAGDGDCYIRLLDGDENGTPLQSTTVYTGGSGPAWVNGEVVANASSGVLTVVWELQNLTSVEPGGHADGLTFQSDCHAIWADGDDDGDVDMDDFAMWQRCVSITGVLPADPYCPCFDRMAPFNQVDEADFPAFEHCSSGPGIPWTSCEP